MKNEKRKTMSDEGSERQHSPTGTSRDSDSEDSTSLRASDSEDSLRESSPSPSPTPNFGTMLETTPELFAEMPEGKTETEKADIRESMAQYTALQKQMAEEKAEKEVREAGAASLRKAEEMLRVMEEKLRVANEELERARDLQETWAEMGSESDGWDGEQSSDEDSDSL